ncbi:hypothetical protein WSM22_19260 [Cytophagales bacterium WSM2-2]|nr:hypothetical protein WSM22_19260 [Cytophagales bacterium WSM2-2]
MKSTVYLLLFVAGLFPVTTLSAQGPDAPPGAAVVVYSWKDNALKSDLPFDKPIYLSIVTEGMAPKPAKVDVSFCKGLDASKLVRIKTYNVYRDGNFYVILDNYTLDVAFDGKKRFLEPANNYTYQFIFYDTNNNEIPNTRVSNGTTTKTKFGNYIKPDFGFAYSPAIKATIGFTSAHLYLTAINDDSDLGEINSFKRNILLRTSFFFGISPLTINSDTKQPITKLGSAGNFVYGIGIRAPFYGYALKSRTARALLQPMRLTFGEIVFKQTDANSLIVHDNLKQTFYVGLSFDFNIGALFAPIAKLYTP